MKVYIFVNIIACCVIGGRNEKQLKLWASGLLLTLQCCTLRCHSVMCMHKLVFGDNPGKMKQCEHVLLVGLSVYKPNRT